MPPATFESAPPEEAKQRLQNAAPGLLARLPSGPKVFWQHLSTLGVYLGFSCDFRARLAEPSANKCELSVLATKSGCSLDPPPSAALPAMSTSSDEDTPLAAVVNTKARNGKPANAANGNLKRPHSDSELSDEPLVCSLLPSNAPLF